MRTACLLGLLGALTSAACGRGEPSAGAPAADTPRPAAAADASAAAVDACTLVSEEEVGRALGASVGPGEPAQHRAGDVAMSQCAWRATDGGTGALLAVRRGAHYRPDADAFATYAEDYAAGMGSVVEVQRIDGLGAAALWDATNHVLLVRPAEAGWELHVQPYPSSTVPMIPLPAARALAEVVLARLP